LKINKGLPVPGGLFLLHKGVYKNLFLKAAPDHEQLAANPLFISSRFSSVRFLKL